VTFAGRFERVHDAVVLPRPVPPPPLMIGSPGDRVLRAALAHVDAWNVWSTCTGTRLTGSRERIPASVSSFASPGGTPPTSCTVQRCSSRLKVVEEIDRRRSTHRHSQGLPTGSPTGSRNSPRLASTRRFCRQPNHRTLNPSARRQPSPFSARPHGGTRDRVQARYRDPRRAAWRGHCFAGRSSTDGIVLDLAGLDSISVADDGLATIGAGACLAQVYAALQWHGRTIPAGCGDSVLAGRQDGGGCGLAHPAPGRVRHHRHR
jgi:hypothetical protein